MKDLEQKITEEQLKAHFKDCGEVKQVLICKGANGKSRGFGFVEFAEASQAQVALSLSGSQLGKRNIVVSKSQRSITQKGVTAKPAEDAASAPVKRAAPAEEDATANKKRKSMIKLAEEAPAQPKKGEKLPFRAVKEMKQNNADADAKPAEAPASAEPAKPMNNADFRALLLKG